MTERTPLQEKIYQAICRILVNDFEVNADDLRWDGLLYDDYDIDSIDAVDMIVQLRSHLGNRRVSPEDFKKVRTLGDVVDVIVALIESKESA